MQCVVDWRKMTLTNSDNTLRLKHSKVDLLGVFCMPQDPLIEVAPDMHTKFIIFGDEDCILGSFNITFDRWGANWESGMTFHSPGVCRLLDNVFQSIRGGVVQRYGVDPLSHFNLLYTFGRQATLGGKYYRPHQAILSEIHRAKRSIKPCLFLIGELQGEYQDSVVDALIAAKQRGVDVRADSSTATWRAKETRAKSTRWRKNCGGRSPGRGAVASRRHPDGAGLWRHRPPRAVLPAALQILRDRRLHRAGRQFQLVQHFGLFPRSLGDRRSSGVARAYLHEFHQILRLFRFPSLSFKL